MKGMRLFTVALLLLHALAASAQPFVGDETLSDVLRQANALISAVAPAVSMAQDHQGVAIAWTMRNVRGINAAHVARLDAIGRISGPVVEVPPVTTGNEVDAYWPSIAVSPTGTGFTLAWVELLRVPLTDSASAVYCELDAELRPSARRLMATMPATKVTAPAIVRSGKTTWISFNGSVREIRAGGLLGPNLDAGVPASDMVATSDYPKVVGQANRIGNVCAYIPWYHPPGCPATVYDLRFVSLYTGSATRRLGFRSDFWPAIESDGRDVLVVWMNGEQSGHVTAVRLSVSSFARVEEDLLGGQNIGTFGPEAGVATRPDIATDGERYVVVWSTKTLNGGRDVVGAIIDRDGHVTSLSIATTGADEHDPTVLMTAPGNFLVAYGKLSSNERRVATRTLKFNRRRRAVH